MTYLFIGGKSEAFADQALVHRLKKLSQLTEKTSPGTITDGESNVEQVDHARWPTETIIKVLREPP